MKRRLKEDGKTQIQAFKEVASQRAHKCELTGVPLDLDLWAATDVQRFISCFHHILPKGLYGNFGMRVHPDNIIIVHPRVHNQIEENKLEEPFFSMLEARKPHLHSLYKKLRYEHKGF